MTRTLSVCLALVLAPSADAQTLTVTGGKADQTNVVVTAPLPKGVAESVNVVEFDGGQAPAQITGPSLLSGATGKQLSFVLPRLPAGKPVTIKPATLNYFAAPPHFRFAENKAEGYTDLVFDKQPVLRYAHAPHDASTKDRHDLTFKPFHHVFEPAKGEFLLTSGAYTFADKTKLFPHHRGLFYGWMRITYGDGRQADTWHGRKGEFTEHDKVLAREAGEVLGRQRSAISWHGADGKTFANEQREVTAYRVPGGTLIDFASVLTTALPKVKLDGDPQHAGFHFRATQEVSKDTKGETYYLRPDGKDKPGRTRNWDAKTRDPKTVNLPWNAMSFVTHGKRYTVLRMNHPANPGESRGSERDYGRFGDYFEYELTPEKPLKVRYRVWVQEGEMTKEQCEAMHQAFIEPPAVK